MELTFKVNNQWIERTDKNMVVADSKNYLTASFMFSDEWRGTKTAIFTHYDKSYSVILENGSCMVPWEVIKPSSFAVSVFCGDLITANKCSVSVTPSGYVEGETPSEPTPDVYSQIIEMAEEQAFDAKLSESFAKGGTGKRENEDTDNAKYYSEEAKTAKQTAIEKAEEALQSAAAALSSEQNAKTSETNSSDSEISALEAMNTAVQAMQDLLSMMGNDIATLTDGKLTPSQIPPLSINDVFEVANIEEMLELVVERGDVALLMADNVVQNSYIMAGDDPSILENWKKLGVSYVANSGHAVTADEAVNATKINNKRLVGMTESQFSVAVKDPDTFYATVPDEVI